MSNALFITDNMDIMCALDTLGNSYAENSCGRGACQFEDIINTLIFLFLNINIVVNYSYEL